MLDLLIVGGGINGAGIARDAAGRGLRVMLVEQDDLASHTSSASTKLIHGGLRYLEHYAFRFVRESLIERNTLLAIAPHIISPLRFVMPLQGGKRPAWLMRLGLFLYDHLGPRGPLPASKAVSLSGPMGDGLKRRTGAAFSYSDCRVDDARLVILNALDASERGAQIRVHTRFLGAERDGDGWRARLADRCTGTEYPVRAKVIVNAAGPWVGDVGAAVSGTRHERPPRMVKGSHIIVPKRFDGDHAYLFQNPDGRIMFAIPYEQAFTLIGTTDIAFTGDPPAPQIDGEEIAYLCANASRYLDVPVTPGDIVYSYSGVRPLYDDGADDVSDVTRDYVLSLGTEDGPQMLSVFGGKITTYRRLAEHALERLGPYLPATGKPWTASVPLPGGDCGAFDPFLEHLLKKRPFLPPAMARRLAHAYGSRVDVLLGGAQSLDDLGTDLGGGLTTREIDYLAQYEWAMTAEDILWRRSKLGLHVPAETPDAVALYLTTRPKEMAS